MVPDTFVASMMTVILPPFEVHTIVVVSKTGMYWELGSVCFPFAPQRYIYTVFCKAKIRKKISRENTHVIMG